MRSKHRSRRHKVPTKVLQVRALRKLFPEQEIYSCSENRTRPDVTDVTCESYQPLLGSASNQHVKGHRFCPACEKARLAIMDGELSSEMLFSVAATIWLDLRVKIGPRTRQDYKRYIKALNNFFKLMPLKEIHIGHVRQYQKERADKAGAIVVNKEIGTLLQIRGMALRLRRHRRSAREADELEECYEPLPLPYWTPPKTITDEQEQGFLAALRSRPEWEMVYCYAILALNTGARGCEIRALKIGDINIPAQEIIIRTAAKNKWAVRKVPLVASALWAAQRLLEIAKEKGSVAPHHCAFPFRLRREVYDNERPMTYSGIKKPWTEARELAGVPDFVPHNSRHQATTHLAESGADQMTMKSILGWTDGKMWEHYSTPRRAHKASVMEAGAFGGKRLQRA